MERGRKSSQRSTADLLVWSETPLPDLSPQPRPTVRHHQPPGGITPVMFGGPMSEEEAESVLRRKPCSVPKLKEITGSSIFAGESENGDSESGTAFSTPINKTSVKIYQQAASGISQISFSAEENITPKKPTTIPEVAKQRELSGTLASESESTTKKPVSEAKNKELTGHNIFGPPPEFQAKPLAPRNLELRGSISFSDEPPQIVNTSSKVSNPASEEPVIKTAKKIPTQKFQQLTGNDIFKEDVSPASAEKPLSKAKLKEISGSDIFADGKIEARDYFGGVRKPPGGESSIALV